MPDPAGQDPTVVGTVIALALSLGAVVAGFLKGLGELMLKRLERRWRLDGNRRRHRPKRKAEDDPT